MDDGRMKSASKVRLASVLFGLIHSALASLAAKRLAVRLLGERCGNGLYRLFFGLQSLVLLNLYNTYIFHHLPDRVIYEVRGPLRWLIKAGWLATRYT